MATQSSISFEQLENVLKRLTFGQQMSLLLLILLAVGGILAASYFVGQPSYQVLYSGMNPEDVGAVVAKLGERAAVPVAAAIFFVGGGTLYGR